MKVRDYEKHIIFRGKTWIVTRNPVNGIWYDQDGGMWDFADPSSSVDQKARCGVGLLSLPDWPFFRKLNEACGVHDHLYESPAYQAFHTREEADTLLENLLALSEHPRFGRFARRVSELYGADLWENPHTR